MAEKNSVRSGVVRIPLFVLSIANLTLAQNLGKSRLE